ncbi:MAG: hypothetical protein DYG94_01435 [Leptolyngbya sp. PLA3]|nr:MAG: hypothetical protein EDM82_00445 [Cyanobacteria bacterium CYA]MCE7967394.1 hypothetical protein [Leptolyngbya sp. PL-A3]
MPDACVRLSVHRPFQSEDMMRMRQGLIPRQMEDKWFIYWEDDALCFHRSWTGICIFVLRFQQVEGVWSAVECTVNRDPEQYGATDDDRDLELLLFLIDRLLLGRRAEFPSRQADPGKAALEQWHIIGRAMLQEPDEQPG